ncbi:hypothetical protein J1N35_034222, partial [Gossypium stocksii]
MGKRNVSDKVMARVSVQIERVVFAPKFKRRKVSAIQDFPPGYKRGTASDLELNRKIATNQSSQG